MDIVGTSMNNLRERSIAEPLSDRETEILGLLAGGLSNREIAQELFLSLETIKWYNKHIYSKLGVGSRTQAVARARELGLFADPGESPVASLAPVRTNLPAQLTSFVGREREIAEVEDLLKTTRLVTLTGPPGIGKTRLGLQLADTVAGNYSDGVIFVGLASTTDPALVPKAIAHKLGVVEQPNQPLVESLERYFGNKSALLVLDNYEHVLEAAALVTDLLAASPRLTVLVTSREVLRLNGEHEYIVPPLTVPDTAHPGFVSDLFVYESMALLNHRARAASTHFRLTEENAPAVAAICLRLDGLPLAIELAAARIKLFSPQQMLERLESRLSLLTGGARDLPARQRTLRDSIDWSYNLLDEDEQRLFARLAVFTGGRTIGAVEAICTPGLPIDALDGLESLLNKSLLYQEEGPGGEPRFIMLETIHEYARERLTSEACPDPYG
jgi:predicted ATPase/DNA-binding CsgD family transcriptional regulator